MSLYDFPAKHTTPQVLEAIYRDGFPGCHLDPAAVEDVVSQEIVQTFSQACPHLRGLHATRDHAYHFLSLIQLEARAGFARVLYEDERQPYGNCVSRGSQHARATTNAVEIHVAGEAEQYVRPAWESTYRGRGHRGHGMNPATAARIDVDRGFPLAPQIRLRRPDHAERRLRPRDRVQHRRGRGNGSTPRRQMDPAGDDRRGVGSVRGGVQLPQRSEPGIQQPAQRSRDPPAVRPLEPRHGQLRLRPQPADLARRRGVCAEQLGSVEYTVSAVADGSVGSMAWWAHHLRVGRVG
jgi:hypothetical protein